MRSPQIEKLPFKEVYNMRPESLSPQSPNRNRSTNKKSRIFKYQRGSNSQARQQNNNRPSNIVPIQPNFIQGSGNIGGIRNSINNGSRVIGYENINNSSANFSYGETNQNANNNRAASNISYIERLQTEFDGNRHLHITQNGQKIVQKHIQVGKNTNIKINYVTPTTSEYFRPVVTYSTGSKINSSTAAEIPLIRHIPVQSLEYSKQQQPQPVIATTTIIRKPQAITDFSKTSANNGVTNNKNKVIDFDNNANLRNIQIHIQPQSNMIFLPGSEPPKTQHVQQQKLISHTIQYSKAPSAISTSTFSNNISMMPVHAYRPAPASISVNTNEVGRLSSITVERRQQDGNIIQNKQKLMIAGNQPEQQKQVGNCLRYEFKSSKNNNSEISKNIPNSFSTAMSVCQPLITSSQNMNAQFANKQLGGNCISSFQLNPSANEQSISNQKDPINPIGASNTISPSIQNQPFAFSTTSTHQNNSRSMDVSQVRRIQHIPIQIISKKDKAIAQMQCQPLFNQLSQVSQPISFPQPHKITQIYRPSQTNPIYSRTITKVHPQPVASYTTIRPLTPYGKQFTIPSQYKLSSQIKPQLHYQFEESPTYVSVSRHHSQLPDSLLQPLQLDFMDYVQKNNRNNTYKTDGEQMRNQAIQPKRQPHIPQYSSYIQSVIPPPSYIPPYSGINLRPEFNNRMVYSNSVFANKHSADNQDNAMILDRRAAQTDRQKKDQGQNNSRSRSRSRSRVNIFDFVKNPNRQSRFSHQVFSSRARKQEEINFQPHTVLSPKNVRHEKYEPKHNYRISIANNESESKEQEGQIQKRLEIPKNYREKNRLSSENEESSNQKDSKGKWRQRLSKDKIKRFFSRSKGKEDRNKKEKHKNSEQQQDNQEEGQQFEQRQEQSERGEGKQSKGKWRNRVKGFFGGRGKKEEKDQKNNQNNHQQQQQNNNDSEGQQQEQKSKWPSQLSTNPIKGFIHKIKGNNNKADKAQDSQEQQEDDNQKYNNDQNKQGQSKWRDKFSRKKIKGIFSRSHGKEDKNTKTKQRKDTNEQEGEEEENGKQKGKWRKKVKGLINKVRGKDEVGDHQKKANQTEKNGKKNQKQKSEKSKEKKGKQLVSINSAKNTKNNDKQADGNVSDDENSGGWKRYFDQSVQGVIKRLDTVGTTVKQLLAPKKQQPQSKYETWKTQKVQQSPLPRNIDRRLTIRDEFSTNYLKNPQQYSSPPQISADFDQMNQLSLSDIKQKDDVMNRSSSSRGVHRTRKQNQQKKVSKSNKVVGNRQQRNQDMKDRPGQKKEGLGFLEIFMIAGLIGIGVAMVMFQILR